MLQTEEASTSAAGNNIQNNATHKNAGTIEKTRMKRTRIYSTRLFFWTLFLMVLFGQARASFNNYIKVPDELLKGCSPELLHTHSFRHFANLCKSKPAIAVAAYEGLQDSMESCRERMRFQSWDCSQPGTILHEPSLLRYGYRETAYLLAMSAAGTAWGVATACAHGWVDECKCVKPESFVQESSGDFNFDNGLMSTEGAQMSVDDWSWSGCSYGVDFGIKTSRAVFTRTGRLPNPLRKLERHNLKAGRLAFKKTLASTCKCHGVSGSCQQKTCWKKTSDLRTIVDHLTDRYYKAKQVTNEQTKIKHSDLVYLEPSPESCSQYTYDVTQRRSLPRICSWRNETHSMGDCETLCCGRGASVRHEPISVRCDCRIVDFQYRCKQCLQHQWVSTCRH